MNITSNNILSPSTAIFNAVRNAESGVISKIDAVTLITSSQVEALLHNQLGTQVEIIPERIIARGINASPGAATGQVFFDFDRAKNHHEQKKGSVILVRIDLKPEDIDSVAFSKGWLISHSGATSHVAIVARQKGIPCVIGINNIKINEAQKKIIIGDFEISEGDWITIDGSTGIVISGQLDIIPPNIEGELYLHKLLGWADEIRTLAVHANADTPEDAELAKKLGAEGIGVCRTEHMFLDDDILPYVQRLILSNEFGEYLKISSQELERLSIEKLLPLQRKAFYKIFSTMLGMPVIIRLLDMSIDEFISNEEKLLQNIQPYFQPNCAKAQVNEVVSHIHEINPMLGFRGSRLGILRPAIYEMQVRAIIEAACDAVKDNNGKVGCVLPKIMIPLVSYSEELRILRELVDRVADKVMAEKNCKIIYHFGTMIETPRAAVISDKLAKYAQFFSFGTNDLTQTTTAISRDDAENRFLLNYIQEKIITENPFQVLDRNGVGYLIKLATEKGRLVRKNMEHKLEVGICGEHGGDEESISFCFEIGLDYVSCSPSRVPVARLAAAHAKLNYHV